MKFETRFSCGDLVWVFNDRAEQMTVGQIRIEYTQSEGVNDGYVEPNCNVAFDNYKPQEVEYIEQYMCVESGIRSGRIYTLGKHAFATKEECEAANADRIAEEAARQESVRQYKRSQLLAEEATLRMKLERIEQIKAEEQS